MAHQKPIPIILCGKSEQIGSSIIQNLKPEYEDAVQEIPFVLRGENPPTYSSKLGSGDYSEVPQAVVAGGGYDDKAIEDISNAIRKVPNGEHIPLLMADGTVPMPPLGPEYGKKILERAKAGLKKVEADGHFGASQGGVHLY